MKGYQNGSAKQPNSQNLLELNHKPVTRLIRSALNTDGLIFFGLFLTPTISQNLWKVLSHVLIPAIAWRNCNQLERDVLLLPARFGGLGLGNPPIEAPREYKSSVEITTPLVEQIKAQQHHLPEDSAVKSSKQTSQHKRDKDFKERVNSVYDRAPLKTSEHQIWLPKRVHRYG